MDHDHASECRRYSIAIQKDYIERQPGRPIMYLSVKKEDPIKYESEDNTSDSIKDIEYCPFCQRHEALQVAHPKPDESHPRSNRSNWCDEFWTALELGSIKYKNMDGSDKITVRLVSRETYNQNPKGHQIVGISFCPYCHTSVGNN